MNRKIAFALPFALLGSVALAQTMEPSKPTVPPTGTVDPVSHDANWDDTDSNRDGFITKDELKGSPALLHRFDQIDTDHDNKLSQAEWKAQAQRRNAEDH